MPASTIKAILFDADGVIQRSSPVRRSLWAQLLGGPDSPRKHRTCVSHGRCCESAGRGESGLLIPKSRRVYSTAALLCIRPDGGRTWWAHFAFTRINIQLTIRKNQVEDLRGLGASRVQRRCRNGEAGR